MNDEKIEILISEVKPCLEPDKLGASLNLVLPGAFSGEVPSVLPWVVDG